MLSFEFLVSQLKTKNQLLRTESKGGLYGESFSGSKQKKHIEALIDPPTGKAAGCLLSPFYRIGFGSFRLGFFRNVSDGFQTEKQNLGRACAGDV